MSWITLIKYAVIAACVGIVVFGIHQNGRTVERAVWLQKESDEKERLQSGINQIVAHVEEQNKNNQTVAAKALNDREKQIEELNKNYSDLLNSNNRLRFKTSPAKCDRQVSGQTKDSSVSDGAITVELPREIESGIRAIGRDDEKELINCNTLKKMIAPAVEIIK